MKEFTLEEIKEVFSKAQLKVIENFERRADEAGKKLGQEINSMTRMAMTMQNMMAIVELEKEVIEELERR